MIVCVVMCGVCLIMHSSDDDICERICECMVLLCMKCLHRKRHSYIHVHHTRCTRFMNWCEFFALMSDTTLSFKTGMHMHSFFCLGFDHTKMSPSVLTCVDILDEH